MDKNVNAYIMTKLTITVLFLVSFYAQLPAQNIEDWVAAKKPLLFEKLYLHVDRELFAPGDKIWLKAYQVNGITHKLNNNFRNIFVQLISEEGLVVKDMKLFSIKGLANGEINTDSLANGIYTIRAYTKYLENFGEEAYFHKKIWIGKSMGSLGLPEKQAQADDPKIDVTFLPEAGNMVLNAVNTVAFKAIDQNGRGIDVSGKIINDLGESIVSFHTSYRGMGKFVLMPVDGRTYDAVIDQDPGMKIRLDAATPDGIGLNYKENGDSLRFAMTTNMKLMVPRSFYFVASHKGMVLFNKKIEMNDFAHSLSLGKDLFPKGISKISLLDTLSFQPFAQRLIFVDDGKEDVITLQLNKQEFNPREEINIGVEALLPSMDSINSTLSVAVVGKNYFAPAGNSQTIESYLLLDSDLKGAIELPALYFVDDEEIQSMQKLDLLMMVNGWSAYIWEAVEAVKTFDVEAWNDAGIEIKGFVKKLLWDGPKPDTELTLSSGGNFFIEKTVTDELGRFNFKRVYLSNITKVRIDARTKNGTRQAEIILDPELKMDTVISVGPMKNTCFDLEMNKNFNSINSFRRMKELEFNPEKGSILLSVVDIIKAKAPKGDGHFRIYTDPDNSMTVTENDSHYLNVLDYLEGKVGGLVISGDKVSIRGGGRPLFLVDGIAISGLGKTEEDVIREIKYLNMSDIDKVEVLKSPVHLAMFGSEGGNGVISIFTKTTSATLSANNKTINGRIEASIRGFQKAQKFYSPSYTADNINNPQPDYRPTLLWEPALDMKSGKANINFFVSDELADYVVFVEGITKNGKICFGTTSFTVGKK